MAIWGLSGDTQRENVSDPVKFFDPLPIAEEYFHFIPEQQLELLVWAITDYPYCDEKHLREQFQIIKTGMENGVQIIQPIEDAYHKNLHEGYRILFGGLAFQSPKSPSVLVMQQHTLFDTILSIADSIGLKLFEADARVRFLTEK
jgi:hypothetical protein